MVSFRSSFIAFLFTGLLFSNADAAVTAKNYYRTFWSPTYHGSRLDHCASSEATCGLSVATRYCQKLGYQRADEQVIDYNVGKTLDISRKRCCKGWQCNGFMKIRCVSSLTHKPVNAYYYRSQTFAFPRIHHARVDWCYENGKGCGKRAAHSFCRRMGYTRSQNYKIQNHIPETRAIGNHQLCLGRGCHAFSHITCYR